MKRKEIIKLIDEEIIKLEKEINPEIGIVSSDCVAFLYEGIKRLEWVKGLLEGKE